MSVYRDKRSQYWQYEFQIKGHRFYGSTRADDEREAREIEAEKKREARAQIDRWIAEQRAPLTLGRAAERWWNEWGQHLGDTKIKAALDRLVEIMGSRTLLHAINDDAVSRMIEERRKDTRRDSTILENGRDKILYRPIKPATVNRTLDLLRRVMIRARDNWSAAITRMPLWKKHRLPEKKGRVREISHAEEETLDLVESFDHAEMRRFAIITGLRLKNLFLTWPQVDFEHATFTVMTKTGPRTLPLSREAYAMLWRRRGHHPEFVWTSVCVKKWRNPHNPKDIRIVGQRYPITYYGFESQKDRSWKKAGVKARIHDLRHTNGMRTLRKTRNLRLVQEQLGHATIKTTAEFYTHATVEDIRLAMEETHSGRRQSPAKSASEK